MPFTCILERPVVGAPDCEDRPFEKPRDGEDLRKQRGKRRRQLVHHTREKAWEGVGRHWKALEGVIRRGKACEGVRCGEIAPDASAGRLRHGWW